MFQNMSGRIREVFPIIAGMRSECFNLQSLKFALETIDLDFCNYKAIQELITESWVANESLV